MVKNLDTKEIWKFSKSFVKREGILLLACVLAVASSLAVVPKAEYIDWRVLVLLYCLMLVVGGFKKRRVLDNCAVRLFAEMYFAASDNCRTAADNFYQFNACNK